MFAFITRRAGSGLVLLASLTFLTFLVFNTIPTNPACLVVACGPHTTTSDAQIKASNHLLGIDRPVVAQYGSFVWHLVRHGDFGTSWTNHQNVRAQLGAALPVTASLVGGGMLLMLLLAFPLATLGALHPRSLQDRGLLALTVVGLAVHPFVLGIGLRKLFANELGTPSSGYCSPQGSNHVLGCAGVTSWISHLAVPWLVFALLFLPLYVRMIRGRVLENLNEPWISTARAKGASEPRVVIRHTMRNAIGPVLPLIALDAGTAITAAIYIETVFGLPGLGYLAVQAFSGQAGGYDLPLTVGIVTTVGAFVVALNLLADIAGAWVDPRVRLRSTPTRKKVMPMSARGRTQVIATAVALALVALGAYEFGHRRAAPAATAPARSFAAHFNDTFNLLSGSASTKPAHVRTGVSKIEAEANGWRVYASVTNDSTGPVQIWQPPNTGQTIAYPNQGMSLVLSPTADDVFKRYIILSANSFNPPIPRTLNPHETWTGSFAGNDVVPKGRKVFVGFGIFIFPGGPRGSSFTTSRAIVVR